MFPACTRCGRPLGRSLTSDEAEGGYGYCDACETDYQQSMAAEEERLNREGRSLYGVFCGYCGRLRSFDEVTAGGDCPCGGADAYYLEEWGVLNELAQIEADTAAENASYNLRMNEGER